ncbi:hydrogenase maturation protease [Halothece sp. PCC 7418]|uniref:hydrogenase maturation protease n=1 Tax=Halothece sp. (strain PCC 7418) TaxID=65093 RepID=UPI0005A18865|nr:hydrogenase maturation protease [Halothece sp. PCC 7418]
MSQSNQSTLVIGYGNSLRSDDGIGLKVATEVENWEISGVQCLAIHQLTPELAATLAEVDRAIFVDAALNCKTVTLEVIQAEEAQGRQVGHFCDARSLLAMSQFLYSHTPSAWLVTIPVAKLDFGEQFSPLAEEGATEALKIIENLLIGQTNPLA